jgi:hypothetical protein
VLGAFLTMAGCEGEPTSPAEPAAASSPDLLGAAAATDSVILMAAGDMHTECKIHSRRAKATAAIVNRYPQALVIPLGDNAGFHATPADYACYDLSWGAFKSRTYAAIGNHEVNQDTAGTAHYDYFNGVGVDSGRAGHRGRGYYTVDYGRWRIFVANSERDIDDQAAWITKELSATPKRCTMAVFHRPRYTSSAKPLNVQLSSLRMRPLWKALYDGGAELVLSGHTHNYERFGELTPDGMPDAARGLRQFVVGTGGSGLYDFNAVPTAGSEKRIKTWGVLKLTLFPSRYKWQFIDTTGAVLDQGHDTCH